MISRTKDFKESFEKSLRKHCDKVYLLDIFKARKEGALD
jgi:UDP-N-acetylmuramate-alanine ligase